MNEHRASSRDYYSKSLPARSRTKKKDLREMSNLEWWAIRRHRNAKGRSFDADGPTTEKTLRSIIAKRARRKKSSPLAAEHSQHPTRYQNRVSRFGNHQKLA